MLSIKNTSMFELNPVYTHDPTVDFDITQPIQEIFTDKYFTPINPSSPVEIKDGSKIFTQDEINHVLYACLGETIDPDAEEAARDLNTKIILNSTGDLQFNQIFAEVATNKYGDPMPSTRCVYTVRDDVIPHAKAVIATGMASAQEPDYLFYAMANALTPNTLGVACLTESVFDEFKQFLNNKLKTYNLQPDILNKFSDMLKDKLNELTHSIMLRNDVYPDTDPLSFSRILTSAVLEYAAAVNNNTFTIFPFTVKQLIMPESITFINIEKHARASRSSITKEWEALNKIHKILKVTPISLKKISKLSSIKKQIQTTPQGGKSGESPERSREILFKTKQNTTVDIYKYVIAILRQTKKTNMSMNTFLREAYSYNRPNRREPDNPDRRGKYYKKYHRPDIHIYLDTSGSISEENYKSAITACIELAKKLNVDMYFNSFSHVISQTKKLHIKDRSKTSIYKEFVKTPKVTGGTDFEEVWKFINQSEKRKREVSLMITDFGYGPPNTPFEHPRNLYYMPVQVSNYQYDDIIRYATQFTKAMQLRDKTIRTKILM